MNKYIMKCVLWGLVLLIPSLVYSARVDFLITPQSKAAVVFYKGQKKNVVYRVVNNSPYALKANRVVDLPAGITQAAGGCGAAFNLNPGQACVLNFIVDADKLKVARFAPKVCNSNRVYCSLPSADAQLNLVKSKLALTVLSASPASLSLTAGGASQTLTITNKGAAAAQAIKLLRAPGLGIVVSSNCPASLSYKPGQNSCKFQFKPGKQTGSTSVDIGSSNSAAITEQIKVSNVPVLTLKVAPLTINLVPGASEKKVLLMNTSKLDAHHLVFALPTGVNLVSVGAPCDSGDLLANKQCILTFSAKAVDSTTTTDNTKDETTDTSTTEDNSMEVIIDDIATEATTDEKGTVTDTNTSQKYRVSTATGGKISIGADALSGTPPTVTVSSMSLDFTPSALSEVYSLSLTQPIMIGTLKNKGTTAVTALDFALPEGLSLVASKIGACQEDEVLASGDSCTVYLQAYSVFDKASLVITDAQGHKLEIPVQAH